MLHEACTVNDLARSIPRINAALEDRQVDHQSTTLEVEGKILNEYVSIIIDSRASLIYISPKIVEKCQLVKEKQKNSWLV